MNQLKNFIVLLILVISFNINADTEAFKLTLGKTTVGEMTKIYPSAKNNGINIYSNGEMYIIPIRDVSMEKLKDLLLIFNENQTLVAVVATINNLEKMKNQTFNYFNGILKKKYKLVTQKRPFVGNQYAKYINGNDIIELDAPHLSFDMTLLYATKDFKNKYKKTLEQKNYNKKKKTESLL